MAEDKQEIKEPSEQIRKDVAQDNKGAVVANKAPSINTKKLSGKQIMELMKQLKETKGQAKNIARGEIQRRKANAIEMKETVKREEQARKDAAKQMESAEKTKKKLYAVLKKRMGYIKENRDERFPVTHVGSKQEPAESQSVKPQVVSPVAPKTVAAPPATGQSSDDWSVFGGLEGAKSLVSRAKEAGVSPENIRAAFKAKGVSDAGIDMLLPKPDIFADMFGGFINASNAIPSRSSAVSAQTTPAVMQTPKGQEEDDYRKLFHVIAALNIMGAKAGKRMQANRYIDAVDRAYHDPEMKKQLLSMYTPKLGNIKNIANLYDKHRTFKNIRTALTRQNNRDGGMDVMYTIGGHTIPHLELGNINPKYIRTFTNLHGTSPLTVIDDRTNPIPKVFYLDDDRPAPDLTDYRDEQGNPAEFLDYEGDGEGAHIFIPKAVKEKMEQTQKSASGPKYTIFDYCNSVMYPQKADHERELREFNEKCDYIYKSLRGMSQAQMYGLARRYGSDDHHRIVFGIAKSQYRKSKSVIPQKEFFTNPVKRFGDMATVLMEKRPAAYEMLVKCVRSQADDEMNRIAKSLEWSAQ